MHDAIARCSTLALHTEEPGHITRTFLSKPMRAVHADLTCWMAAAGMPVWTDAAGNLRGLYPAREPGRPRLLICSHLDTVPHAGAFDGILGVILGVQLVEQLAGRRLQFAIEVVGFSEEEGVRFGFPFIGSRALTGTLTPEMLARQDSNGVSVSEAIAAFGLDPSQIDRALVEANTLGSLEFHIEQGPVLESLGAPLGIVDAIAGQSRFELSFTGQAGHAGTTPMHLRRDALNGAADWINEVEREANATPNLVATVGRIHVEPGASNVIPASARLTLDVRHAQDAVRCRASKRLAERAQQIASRRSLKVAVEPKLEQPSVSMDTSLTALLARSVEKPVRMTSGAGHDSMILATRMPTAMLFLRSPGGLSHHPDEAVLPEDVEAALAAGARFLEELERTCV